MIWVSGTFSFLVLEPELTQCRCTAIWDNRSVYHAATFDYDNLGPRTGHRVVGLGEKPYFDPKSTSRQETLEQQEA